MACWLVKSDPDTYSWADLVRDGRTHWDGVRNNQARIYLRAMRKGERVLVYHSGVEKSVVGVAEVAGEAAIDPRGAEDGWVMVDLAAVRGLKQPVTLAAIKADRALREMVLVKNSRLSVQPVTDAELARVLALGQ